jgi:hypothetical protein
MVDLAPADFLQAFLAVIKHIDEHLRPYMPPSGVSVWTNTSVGLLFSWALLINVELATNRPLLTVKSHLCCAYQEYILETKQLIPT